jgi:hypothetical protein
MLGTHFSDLRGLIPQIAAVAIAFLLSRSFLCSVPLFSYWLRSLPLLGSP